MDDQSSNHDFSQEITTPVSDSMEYPLNPSGPETSDSTEPSTAAESGFPPQGEVEDGLDRRAVIGIVVVGFLLLAATIAAVIFMVSNPAATETIRDIMIIFVAFEMSIIGIALIILIIQVAQLSAMLQNEIKPMLEATSDTMNTLRGTSVFLSEHLSGPVMKMNSYASAMRRAVDLIRPKPRKK